MRFTLRYRNRILNYQKRIDEITSGIRSFDQTAGRVLSHLFYCYKKQLNLTNKKSLVFGTGNFLTEAYTLHLLESQDVSTFDIQNLVNHSANIDALKHNNMFMRATEHLIDPAVRDNFKRFQKENNTELLRTKISKIKTITNPNGITQAFIKPNSIDLIYSYNVFEHIPLTDQVGIWTEFTKILAPGGKVIIYIDYSNHHDPIKSPFRHLKQQTLDPGEQGLGFSHEEFVSQIRNSKLKIRNQDIANDREEWEKFMHFNEGEYVGFNGETSALMVLEHA